MDAARIGASERWSLRGRISAVRARRRAALGPQPPFLRSMDRSGPNPARYRYSQDVHEIRRLIEQEALLAQARPASPPKLLPI